MGPLISGKSRLVKYYNLTRMMDDLRWMDLHFWRVIPTIHQTFPAEARKFQRNAGEMNQILRS